MFGLWRILRGGRTLQGSGKQVVLRGTAFEQDPDSGVFICEAVRGSERLWPPLRMLKRGRPEALKKDQQADVVGIIHPFSISAPRRGQMTLERLAWRVT